MTDIVKKLRTMLRHYPDGTGIKRTLNEAATEIESLRNDLLKIKDWYERDCSVGGLENVMDDLENKL